MTRVPVGMSVFVIPPYVAKHASIHASGALIRADSDGSVFSRYTIAASRHAASLRIINMHFKPIQSPGSKAVVAVPGSKAPQLPSSAVPTVYDIQWQIYSVLQQSPEGGHWLFSKSGVLIDGSSNRSSVISQSSTSSAHMLQHLQAHAHAATARLITRGMQCGSLNGPCGRIASPSGSAAAGLLRVASQESSASGSRHLDLSVACPVDLAAPALTKHEGVLDQGVLLQPLMSRVAPSPGSMSSFKQGSGVVITGGIGDVGSLVACWTVECKTGHLWLIGRTGRGDLSAGLMHATCCVTTIACDAAGTADMESLKPSGQWQASPDLLNEQACISRPARA